MPDLMRSIKGYSAREINKLRNSQGSLWQKDYHDEILANEQALRKAVDYLLANPVRRGLAARPEKYPWIWNYWGGFNDTAPKPRNATGKSRPRPF
jgi:putative transposase